MPRGCRNGMLAYAPRYGEQRHHGHLDRKAGHPARSNPRRKSARATPGCATPRPRSSRRRAAVGPPSAPRESPATMWRRGSAKGSGSRAGLPPRTVHRSAAVVVGWPVRRLSDEQGSEASATPAGRSIPSCRRRRGRAGPWSPAQSSSSRSRLGGRGRGSPRAGATTASTTRFPRGCSVVNRSSRRRPEVTLGADSMQAALRRSGGISRIALTTPYVPVGPLRRAWRARRSWPSTRRCGRWSRRTTRARTG